MGTASDFSYDYFRKILQAAKSNFTFRLFSEAAAVINSPGEPALFLRHDVDIDLNKALRIAEIEHEYGVCSTFMILLHSPLYSLEDKASREIVLQLVSMGHEVGLHVDIDNDRRNDSLTIHSIESMIEDDLKQLEDTIQLPVQSISFHRPLPQFLRGPLRVAGRINAYSKELMAWYLSDSAGRWREGEPLPKILHPTGDLLQLLIHPIWWGNDNLSAEDTLEHYFQLTSRGWSAEKVEVFDKALGAQLSIQRSGARNKLEKTHLPEMGQFNTDSTALTQRIEAHEKFGSGNLNDWIFTHLDLANGASVLDLGCGTGNQTIPMAQVVGETGRVFSLDASQKALDVLKQSAVELKVDNRITLACGVLDELYLHVDGYNFDRVLGSYSLYYANDPKVLLETVYQHLAPGGLLFFCGPADDNNAELKLFHNSLLKDKQPLSSRSAKFMEETGLHLAKALFTNVDVYTFQNPLRFNTARALYDYWSSYNLYDKKLDAAFREAADRHFQTNEIFETTKRVIGVKAVK